MLCFAQPVTKSSKDGARGGEAIYTGGRARICHGSQAEGILLLKRRSQLAQGAAKARRLGIQVGLFSGVGASVSVTVFFLLFSASSSHAE